MPNWCTNNIKINGKKETIDKLYELYMTNNIIDFDKIIPYPEEYAEMDKLKDGLGYNSGGYQWCNKNWGTKWKLWSDVDFAGFERNNDEEVTAYFETAWSPPIPVLLELSKLLPVTIWHEFDEGGCAFQGESYYVNGVEEVVFYREGEEYVDGWEDAVPPLCPVCDSEMEFRMVDIDGTNLIEKLVCPECGEQIP